MKLPIVRGKKVFPTGLGQSHVCRMVGIEREFHAYMLREVEGATLADVARHMDLSVERVRQLVARFEKRVKLQLEAALPAPQPHLHEAILYTYNLCDWLERQIEHLKDQAIRDPVAFTYGDALALGRPGRVRNPAAARTPADRDRR